MQLSPRTAATAAGAPPSLPHQRARQRQLQLLDARREPLASRAQLTVGESLEIDRAGHEPVPVSRTRPDFLPPPAISATNATNPPSTSSLNGVDAGTDARSVASSGTPIVPNGPASQM